MNRDELEYKIRTEGINGLTIKSRKMREITSQPLLPDVEEQSDDLRHYTRMGVIVPREDYWISGCGREPIGLREVQTSVSGMKKYAILKDRSIKPDKSKTKSNQKSRKQARITGMEDIANYSVMYVYSEGIDFRRMAEDEAYAEAVISLLQDERLKQKQEQSEQLNSEVIYLGTIAKAEDGYIKAGIRDYTTAVKMIDSDIKRRQEENRKRREARLTAEKREQKNYEIKSFTSDFNKRDWIEMMKKMVSSCGMAESADILKIALGELDNTKPTPQTPDDDEWEY